MYRYIGMYVCMYVCTAGIHIRLLILKRSPISITVITNTNTNDTSKINKIQPTNLNTPQKNAKKY